MKCALEKQEKMPAVKSLSEQLADAKMFRTYHFMLGIKAPVLELHLLPVTVIQGKYLFNLIIIFQSSGSTNKIKCIALITRNIP